MNIPLITLRSKVRVFQLREREMFYLTTHSTHFIYGYMASDIWLRTILIVRKETRCRHIGYSFRLTARVILYSPSHRHDSTYHGLCYTSRGALAGTRTSSMGSPHEGSIRRPIAPRANALTTKLHLAPSRMNIPLITIRSKVRVFKLLKPTVGDLRSTSQPLTMIHVRFVDGIDGFFCV